jgi:glycosyltransferase involved in cell wall biosynthesis
VATIHHGLPLESAPFNGEPGDYLAFVGRITPEKGVADAIELARRTRSCPLRIVAKVYDEHEHEHFAEVVQPAIDDGTVEFLGELPPLERDPIIAGARATVMLGAWPEPFGLVAIESMATGTPVIARRAGALTETSSTASTATWSTISTRRRWPSRCREPRPGRDPAARAGALLAARGWSTSTRRSTAG